MTKYLVDKRERLEARFYELDDVEENYPAFEGIAYLIQWIDEHPQASDLQYLTEVALVKAASAKPRNSRLDMVRERARRMA